MEELLPWVVGWCRIGRHLQESIKDSTAGGLIRGCACRKSHQTLGAQPSWAPTAAEMEPCGDAEHVGSSIRCSPGYAAGGVPISPFASQVAELGGIKSWFVNSYSSVQWSHAAPMAPSDAPCEALSEPPQAFSRASNRTASRSGERKEGRGEEERKPC